MTRTRLSSPLLAAALLATLSTLAGCAGGGSTEASATLSGTATGDAATIGVVELRDASATLVSAQASAQGDFTFDVGALTPPFVLRASLVNGKTLYGVASGPGEVSLDPISTVAYSSATESDDQDDADEVESRLPVSSKVLAVIAKLRVQLAPLFGCYGITDSTKLTDPAFRALFKEVRFEVDDGKVVVTNRQTGKRIFVASLRKLAGGTFTAANLPATCSSNPPPAACTDFTYSDWNACQASNTQSRTVLAAAPAGCDQSAAVLTQACTYVPPTPVTCTSITYSDWGACQSNNTQTRTITASAPAGCDTSAAVLTQSCTYVPPTPVACTTINYTAWSACQPNGTQTRTVTTTAPTGCDASAAVLSQSCTYVAPAALSSVAVSPTSVTGGTSATGTVTLSAAAPTGGAVVALASSSTAATVPASVTVAAGASSATFTVTTQTVTATATAVVTATYSGVSKTASLSVGAAAVAGCTSCHGAPPATGRHSFHVTSMGYACSTCHGAGYSATAQTTGSTHRNGTVDVTISNWNATAKTCGGCHGAGSKTW